MSESKREKFIRLAELRVNNALKHIKLIGNLANTSNYEYDASDYQKIIRTLRKAVGDTEKRFQGKKVDQFKL